MSGFGRIQRFKSAAGCAAHMLMGIDVRDAFIAVSTLPLLVFGCDQAETTSEKAETLSGADATLTVAVRPGALLDHKAEGFRVRQVESDFYWVVAKDFELRIDPRFLDGDQQEMATEIQNRNTMVRFIDPEIGEKILCGKDWDEDVVGDLQRTALTDARIEATFRIELDKCTLNDELIEGKSIVLSGSFSLPLTD